MKNITIIIKKKKKCKTTTTTLTVGGELNDCETGIGEDATGLPKTEINQPIKIYWCCCYCC